MAEPKGILFIVGGGPRIGHSVAAKFLQEGYQVAIGRRTISPSTETNLSGAISVQVDVTKTESVAEAFHKVKTELGIPNVVVYNAANLIFPADADDPFAISPEAFESGLGVNVTGGYAALHHATRGFKQLREAGSNVPLAFIATGNVTPFQPTPVAMTLSSGKAALANLIDVASLAYKATNYGFYFISQVTVTGGTVPYNDVEAEAHGSVYWNTVQSQRHDGRWDLRFAVGDGGNISEDWNRGVYSGQE